MKPAPQPSIVPPGSFEAAAEASLPALNENLRRGSDWMKLIVYNDNPKRANSPYYGPATQFIIDCFLYIAEQNPTLSESSATPLERFSQADFIMRNYIGRYAVGANRLLALTYAKADVARTQAHLNRFPYLQHDPEHILLGATVPFFDVARTCGGAALMLCAEGTGEDGIPDLLARSKKLQIVGGVDGTNTPALNIQLGKIYTEPRFFTRDDDGTAVFTDEALNFIRPFLSKVGCPSAKVRGESGPLFNDYWNKIVHFVLDNVDYDDIQAELELGD